MVDLTKEKECDDVHNGYGSSKPFQWSVKG